MKPRTGGAGASSGDPPMFSVGTACRGVTDNSLSHHVTPKAKSLPRERPGFSPEALYRPDLPI
jgi:hypothetical protein